MDQVRVLIAIVLSFIVFLVWNHFFPPIPKTTEQKPQTQAEQKEIKEENKIALVSNSNAVALTNCVNKRNSNIEPEILTINTNLYTIDISKNGAVFTKATLKNYKENNKKDSNLINLVDSQKN